MLNVGVKLLSIALLPAYTNHPEKGALLIPAEENQKWMVVL